MGNAGSDKRLERSNTDEGILKLYLQFDVENPELFGKKVTRA